MTVDLTPDQVWEEIEKNVFAVIGMVTKDSEARTVGIVYVVRDGRLYIASDTDAWKVRHIKENSHVSLTIPVHKSVPLMPWVKIPAATITFCGEAKILSPSDVSQDIFEELFRGMAEDPERLAGTSVIEVTPEKDFVTYGIGVSLMQMRDPKVARGRAPVGV